MRSEIRAPSLTPAPRRPQVPLEERIIFSGNLFQYQEDNKKWRNRFSLVPHNYGLVLYENKVVRLPQASQAWPSASFTSPQLPILRLLMLHALPTPERETPHLHPQPATCTHLAVTRAKAKP